MMLRTWFLCITCCVVCLCVCECECLCVFTCSMLAGTKASNCSAWMRQGTMGIQGQDNRLANCWQKKILVQICPKYDWRLETLCRRKGSNYCFKPVVLHTTSLHNPKHLSDVQSQVFCQNGVSHLVVYHGGEWMAC